MTNLMNIRSNNSTGLDCELRTLIIDLFHDDMGEGYAKMNYKGKHKFFRIKSTQFERLVRNIAWEKYNITVNNSLMSTVVSTIDAEANFNGTEIKVHERITFHNNEMYYHLGEQQSIKINSMDWNVQEESPLLFREYSHQEKQVLPVRKDSLYLLDMYKYINIEDESQILLYLFTLVSLFIPGFPHPLIVFSGEKGSSKTTLAKMTKELVDPSKLQVLSIPKSQAVLAQILQHHNFMCFDNVSSLTNQLSDSLCRAVTGEGFSKRKLYTDDEDVIYNYQRSVSMTCINLPIINADLLDRSLIFEMAPIKNSERKTEQELWESFRKDKPAVLGEIFSIISRALRIKDRLKMNNYPRMADFALWGTAICIAMGYNEHVFMDAYTVNLEMQNSHALNASPVGTLITALMNNQDYWEGSPTTLLRELERIASLEMINTKYSNFPTDSRWLWRRIKDVKSNLEKAGIFIRKDDSKRRTEGRKIIIEKRASDINY